MISQKKRELLDSLLQHDGVHPHLPKLSEERAAVLLELTRDALYQLFVRIRSDSVTPGVSSLWGING